MTRDFDPRMGSASGDADGPSEYPRKPKRPGGFRDTKKVVILLGLVAAGGLIVAYQFLWARAPKEAAAVVSATSAEAVPSPAELPDNGGAARSRAAEGGTGSEPGSQESDLSGSATLSVDRVEDLARRLGVYVQERQLPLKDLRLNPFEVLATKDTGVVGEKTEPGAKAEERPVVAPPRASLAGRFTLGSVMVAGEKRMAIINGRLCRVGDVVEGCAVDVIKPGEVRLSRDGDILDLSIRRAAGGPREN